MSNDPTNRLPLIRERKLKTSVKNAVEGGGKSWNPVVHVKRLLSFAVLMFMGASFRHWLVGKTKDKEPRGKGKKKIKTKKWYLIGWSATRGWWRLIGRLRTADVGGLAPRDDWAACEHFVDKPTRSNVLHMHLEWALANRQCELHSALLVVFALDAVVDKSNQTS